MPADSDDRTGRFVAVVTQGAAWASAAFGVLAWGLLIEFMYGRDVAIALSRGGGLWDPLIVSAIGVVLAVAGLLSRRRVPAVVGLVVNGLLFLGLGFWMLGFVVTGEA